MTERPENAQTQQEQLSRMDTHDRDARLSIALVYVAEFVKIFIIAAAIILPIRLFLIQPFYVKGSSMEPNFFENEYLIIDKMSIRFHPITRGEVVVFRYPRTERKYLIKRVIGLPGERVEFDNNVITVYSDEYPDGLQLSEAEYMPRKMFTHFTSAKLGEDEYYVLGDNRPVSFDSEQFGPVHRDQIVGRVIVRGLPIQRAMLFQPPEYDGEEVNK